MEDNNLVFDFFAIKQTVHMIDWVCVCVCVCVCMCVSQSAAGEAGSLTPHSDPDSKCSPERGRWRKRQRGQVLKRKSGTKGDRERQRGQAKERERQEERGRPIMKTVPQRDKRGSERGWETERGRDISSGSLRVREERGEHSLSASGRSFSWLICDRRDFCAPCLELLL